MKKKKFMFIIIAIVLCIGLIGFSIYDNFYKIDLTQFEYDFLAQIVPSPDAKYTISIDIYRTTEDSEISYISGLLIRESDNVQIPDTLVKRIFWQKVNSNDIENNWIDVTWLDNETVNINNITVNIFKDVYDYRRQFTLG
jgi:hypothetical protein